MADRIESSEHCETPAATKPPYVVHGVVTGAGGLPLADADVVVWHQRLRDRSRLASGETGGDGGYHIEYCPHGEDRITALIVIEARSEHLDVRLESPPTLAEPDARIDLAAEPVDRSEYAALTHALWPLLEDLALHDLVEDDQHHDITLLAQETGADKERITRLAISARLAERFDVPAPAFFAFLQLRIPTTLPGSLLDASDNFTLIDGLVQRVGSLILALDPVVQANALTAAVKQNIIGQRYAPDIPAFVKRLQEHHATDLLTQPYLGGKTSLAGLLTVAGINPVKQQSFAAAVADNTQPSHGFWNSLRDGQHGFTAPEVSAIERTLSAGALIKNHVPLLQLVLARFKTGELTEISDLARLTQQDWQQAVDRVGAPPSVNATGSATANQVFARVVYARVSNAFPTLALASRVTASEVLPSVERAPLQQFFVNNGGIDLLRHNINTYVSGRGDAAFAGITRDDQPGVVANVRRLQRVLLLIPNADAAHTLLQTGFNSATQIAMQGRGQFVTQATQAGLTERQANRVFAVADQRYAGVVALYTQLNLDALGVLPKAVGDTSALQRVMVDAVSRDQSLQTLFGSQDYCAVDSCTSILSPAAYLCDLLYWLRARMTGSLSALDVLNARRRDIGHLKLNCPNSETPLPYIDLVNEILSDAIAVPIWEDSPTNPSWKQTAVTATAATLRAAPAHFSPDAFATLATAQYPHSLPYSEGLDELRAYLEPSGIQLWQLRQAVLALGPTLAARVAVASERFAMAPLAVDLLITPNFLSTSIAWPATSGSLEGVPVFTQAASISYDELLELLDAGWVQGGLGITIAGVDDTCDTSAQTLQPAPLDDGFLDRAHRFLRAWRATGYAMWELDLLLQWIGGGGGTLDAGGLATLGDFRLLQDRTQLAVDEQLGWFQRIDTGSHRGPNATITTALFARVFLNPVIVSVHPDPDLAAVASGTVIADDNMTHHVDAVQAGLGLSGSDVIALMTALGMDGTGTLTLDNLSLLYRSSQLAAAAKISISELIVLAPLIVSDTDSLAVALMTPFGGPAAASAFLDELAALRQSGFDSDALSYLLRPPAPAAPFWTATTAMTDRAIGAVVTEIRAALLNPNGDVGGSVTAVVAAQLGLAPDVAAYILQNVDLPATSRSLLDVLTDPAAMPGSPHLRAARPNFPDQFTAIQLLDKIRVAVKQLHLVAGDLAWLAANASLYGGMDLSQLPVTISQPKLPCQPLLKTVLLIKLARLFKVAAPNRTLYSVIAGVGSGALADEAATQTALSAVTGWRAADIAALATGLGITFPADYLRPATYDALRTLTAIIGATGGMATGAQLVAWSAVPGSEADAESMAASALNVLKSRYTDNDWLAAAPAIMDPLREHRCAALQDYLIGNGDLAGNTFADSASLFDHFLIDTQMSASEVTTRVVQASIAVQIFVERCRMNLESPAVEVAAGDDAWGWWRWMKRYRIWEAAREVFLYPENWLVESQRPNRTELFKKLEQEVQQNDHTTDHFETVTLNYLDGLDGIANLVVSGTCQDPVSAAIHVVARTAADPPRFYHRTFERGAWSGWIRIPLDIKSHHAVPAVYRGRLCLFWPEVRIHKEPQQTLPAIAASPEAPSQDVMRYVSIAMHSSTFRNGAWAPTATAKGTLFDIPYLTEEVVNDMRAVEALYTLKVQPAMSSTGYPASLDIDVFRFGNYTLTTSVTPSAPFVASSRVTSTQPTAVHIGRAVFDGRFSDLQLSYLEARFAGSIDPSDTQSMFSLLIHAQRLYGPDAQTLVPLWTANSDLVGEPSLLPMAGALVTRPHAVYPATIPFSLTSAPLEIPTGSVTLLGTAAAPFRVVGADASLAFDPTSYFFFQDNRRCFFVEAVVSSLGSAWVPPPPAPPSSPSLPSNPSGTLFEVQYTFRRFYHPYTRLLWHQLGAGGFPALYDTALQQNPDQVDPSGSDVFSFQSTYSPAVPMVQWGDDNEILDFRPDAAYSVYNWELFFHAPLYVAGLLSQNQQFEDAQAWFHYIFDPTRQGTDPAPQRFWIPKPLHDVTSAAILQQRINTLLQFVNSGDPTAVMQVTRWRDDPFNPFLLADLRPVAYMKTVVMQYLDNLIAWADNLFATDSREALNEATLLYIVAAEILGAQPIAVTPPNHPDESFDELLPALDTFANAMVDIENLLGPGSTGSGAGTGSAGGNSGGVGSGDGGTGSGDGVPGPHTFYFKIPPNDKLLGYWRTVADRLWKLRHGQNLQGVTRSLALFDAPIDPALLVRAQAAGVDLTSVLSEVTVALPNYRYTALYAQALDFVNAVRRYGAALLDAFAQHDGAALALLEQTTAQQLLHDADDIYQKQRDKLYHDRDAQSYAGSIAKAKHDANEAVPFMTGAEITAVTIQGLATTAKILAAGFQDVAAVAHLAPDVTIGISGFGGSPLAVVIEGASNVAESSTKFAWSWDQLADAFEFGAELTTKLGECRERKDNAEQAAIEADLEMRQSEAALAGIEVLAAIAELEQSNHQKHIDYVQKQIDFLSAKFTSQELYDWRSGVLSGIYFQSFKLAYRLCKQVERCYRYELGIQDSSFIQFGYWDSLHKGLLAGERLDHDLRRMQASYLDENKRRFEISRYVSLAALDTAALVTLIETGQCDFDLPESLFDNDYPGHYNRHLVRASVSVVYPGAGVFDNVKATLTLRSNKVRVVTTATSSTDYAEVGASNSDPRFTYGYDPRPSEKIVLGNARDDAGLFVTAIDANLNDQRYLPFEGAGAISQWHLEMPQATNEIDVSSVRDVVLHVYYTAQDGGETFKGVVEAYNLANQPSTGVCMISARGRTAAWEAFIRTPAANESDQSLAIAVPPSAFPAWTRGNTITVTGIVVFTVGWAPETFVLEVQAPLAQAPSDVPMSVVAGSAKPNVTSATLAVPQSTGPGTWTFKLRTSSATDFRSLSENDVGDVLFVVYFSVV